MVPRKQVFVVRKESSIGLPSRGLQSSGRRLYVTLLPVWIARDSGRSTRVPRNVSWILRECASASRRESMLECPADGPRPRLLAMRHRHFLFQLPNPLLQELPLWFLLGQRQRLLIRSARLGSRLLLFNGNSRQEARSLSSSCGLFEREGHADQSRFAPCSSEKRDSHRQAENESRRDIDIRVACDRGRI